MAFERREAHTPELGSAEPIADPMQPLVESTPATFPGAGGGDPTALLPWIDDGLAIGSGGATHEEIAHPASHAAKPVTVADSGPSIPKGVKYDPNWTELARGQQHEDYAPKSVVLPDSVDQGLTESWKATVNDPKHREHGGNIVRKYNGDYAVRHGEVGTKHIYEPDYGDKGWTQDFVGTFHTHPYMDEGYDHGTFSGGDFANLANHDGNMNVMRSGSNNTYMMVKTKEFQTMIDAVENGGPDDEIEDRRQAFARQIEGTYDAAQAEWLKTHPGDFEGSLEAGAVATSTKYHIPYYEGTGKNLHRVGGPAKK